MIRRAGRCVAALGEQVRRVWFVKIESAIVFLIVVAPLMMILWSRYRGSCAPGEGRRGAALSGPPMVLLFVLL